MKEVDSIQFLTEKVRAFRDERDWEQFHTPKNVATALNVEASELLELFQWSEKPRLKEGVAEEAADILYMLLLFCVASNINLGEALIAKLEKNAKKYPVDKVKGSAKKYTDY